nr:DUF4038 domain-containing protein [Candidatus Sigynarchaeota archaeon]
MVKIVQNEVAELTFTATTSEADERDVEFDLTVTDPAGQKRTIPGFWAGGTTWRARYSSSLLGEHVYTTACTNVSDRGLHGQAGTISVVGYEGTNPLLMHGKLRASQNKKYIEHADGTPFFWLGDTWWMGFTKRLHWPDEFKCLVEDRVQKGFTLIQIVAGLYPDMPPFDERGANEAEFPWQENKYQAINPAYFDMVDRRVQHLVEAGLVPCIVGFWGYFLDVMGLPAIKKHWRYLVARYGAYPVVWCIAGEAMMRYYLDPRKKWRERKQDDTRRLAAWTEVASYIHSIDGFRNPVTVHPTRYGHEQLDDPGLLDVDMLQTGHANAANEIATINNTVNMIHTARKQQEAPVVVGEVCYEGILEANRQEIQRCLFWANFLSGGAGHTYGANGIWQLNRRDRSYGASPHGSSWGETPWEDAYQLPGSRQVGVGKAILSSYPWWTIEPHPEWVDGKLTWAAGIPERLRIIYRFLPGSIRVKHLEENMGYQALWIDPKDGTRESMGTIMPDKKGTWIAKPRIMQDWIVVLERIKKSR